MKFIDKLERKFGRFGIPNLTIYIIGCYVLGYILTAVCTGSFEHAEPGYVHGHERSDLETRNMGDLSAIQRGRN